MAKVNTPASAANLPKISDESLPNAFRDIFEQSAAYAPVDLVKMAFGNPRPALTQSEIYLIKEQAKELDKLSHEHLAQLAAAAFCESMRLKGIFANFLHCMYHEEKDHSSSVAQKDLRIRIQDEVIRIQPQHFASQRASMAALARLSNDPKQLAKAAAHILWKERRAGMHPKLRTNEQFATECMLRWPVLTSSKVICSWCSAWNKEARDQNPVS